MLFIPVTLRFILFLLSFLYLFLVDWALYLTPMASLHATLGRLLLPHGCRVMLFALGFVHIPEYREDVDPRRLRLLTKGE